MTTTTKAILLNVFFPGVGYIYYKLPGRQIFGWLLAILTFLEIALFIYTPIAMSHAQLTFHWEPFFDPGRLAFRVLLALDTRTLMKFKTLEKK